MPETRSDIRKRRHLKTNLEQAETYYLLKQANEAIKGLDKDLGHANDRERQFQNSEAALTHQVDELKYKVKRQATTIKLNETLAKELLKLIQEMKEDLRGLKQDLGY